MKQVLLHLDRCLRIDATKRLLIALHVERSVRLGELRRKSLHLLFALHIRHRGLHDGLLVARVLQIACTLLNAVHAAKQTARKRLEGRNARLTIGRQDAQSSAQQALIRELLLILIV